jgi:metal-sulfur cluster biosynthetic enzyme
VLEIKEISKVNVEIVWDPPWTQDMMSEEAKLELGIY